MPVTANVPVAHHPVAETDLVQRAKRDPRAFTTLYRQHYGVIARYIYRRVGDPHVTEDLVADVFVLAMRYLPRYRPRGLPFRSWLYRLAVTSVNRWARRQGRHYRTSLTDTGEPADDCHPANGTAVDAANRVQTALLMLPPRFQSVLSLYYLENMTVEQIAAALGCRTGTVKSRLHRARQSLKARLSRGGE